MMKWKDDSESLTIYLSGEIDHCAAEKLRDGIEKLIERSDAETLILDFVELEYLSSAGLRVLLQAQKVMNKQGEMIIRNVNETISEIFEVTGFADILTIE